MQQAKQHYLNLLHSGLLQLWDHHVKETLDSGVYRRDKSFI